MATVSGKIIDVYESLTNAYINISQTVKNDFRFNQIISYDCGNVEINKACNDCLKKVYDDTENISFNDVKQTRLDYSRKMCGSSCKCSISDINFNQIVSLDLTTVQEANVQEKFANEVVSDIYLQAKKSQQNFFGLKDNDTEIESLVEIINKIFVEIKTDIIQEQLSDIKQIQIIDVKGAANIAHIDFNITHNYIYNIFQSSRQISDSVNEIQNKIINYTTQQTKDGLGQIIIWVVQITMIIITVIAFLFSINMFFQLYTATAI